MGLTGRVGYCRSPGIFRESLGISMGGEERFALRSEGDIVRAGLIQERTSFLRPSFQGGSDNFFNLLPLLRCRPIPIVTWLLVAC
jgi:hypothetical protein